MIKLTTKSSKILVVKVPEDAENFDIHDNDGITYDSLSTNTIKEPWGFIDLNQKDGWHEIVGKLSELIDKDCEEFVLQWGEDMSRDIINSIVLGYSDIVKIDENHNLGYKNYIDNFNNNYTLKAKESFISLLQSEGIDTNKEQLIIKLL